MTNSTIKISMLDSSFSSFPFFTAPLQLRTNGGDIIVNQLIQKPKKKGKKKRRKKEIGIGSFGLYSLLMPYLLKYGTTNDPSISKSMHL